MIADDVRNGLSRSQKALPAYLFYDDLGSALYEQITALPEYYLTRVERSILDANADEIVRRARGSSRTPLTIVELGAGSAAKSELVLRAALRRQGECLYVPIDISAGALEDATRRLDGAMPGLTVRPILATHERAFDAIRDLPSPTLAMFIGSSIGNFEDGEALALLRGLSGALDSHSWLLLGTDLRKCPTRLIPAYDDATGVTAAFNKNMLTRINRELGGGFNLDTFKHLARWNEESSRVEMHLVSLCDQVVEIAALSMRVGFVAGETIHTESSVKYDEPRVHRLLAASGFEPGTTYVDPEKLCAVHLASRRAVSAVRIGVAA
jgi:L-histidine N-alpha-methyltransferase